MNVRDEQPITRESAERYDPDLRQGQIIAAEHQARYRWAAAAAAGMEILDAGCGVGYGSAMLADAGATRVAGLDRDPAAIAEASSRYGDRDALRFTEGDLRELPFDASSFDLVVCFETIEHIDRQDAALDELRRVLRDQGHLLISSPNRNVFPPGNPHHVHEYVPEELEKALAARFGVVELWRQHTWLASLVIDDDSAAAGPDREMETSVRMLTKLEPGSELYTLAIAGNTRLTELSGSAVLCEPIEISELVLGTVKARRDIAELSEQLHAARQEMAGLRSSFSWKVTKPLRGAKRLVRRSSSRSESA